MTVDDGAPRRGHLHDDIPTALPDELVTVLAGGDGVRIERIVSRGHCSPPGHWYDQDDDELVVLISGAARLELGDGSEVALGPGDWIDLPRRCRHRVAWTAPDRDTIWLAVFRR